MRDDFARAVLNAGLKAFSCAEEKEPSGPVYMGFGHVFAETAKLGGWAGHDQGHPVAAL
ncbi:hypothetical protein U8607_04185 [Methylobacterium durans]|uniref:hypothetical protein n=1 Tax=Methylobacterium durans TaxID=2202825 RepID=UPI002AFEFBD6|nr:hypothetical protein [Methylobacterium durans]MEA1831276.1 hypothetical protein [Methylobacterium durans]